MSEEKWEHISKLSEIRSKYSCFEDDEEPYYRALSEGIKALKAISSAEPYKGMTNGEVLDKLFPGVSEMLYDMVLTEEWWNRPYKGEQE